MAPPTSSTSAPTTEPLQQRLLKLAQTLQFAWFAGHVTLLLATIRYVLSYVTFNAASRWARFSYRTAFVAAAVTYGIVVYKGFRARQKAGKGQSASLSLAGDENVQYLLSACVWLFTRQIPLALFPYAVYSIFHVATYTRGVLLPVVQPAPPSAAGQKQSTSALSEYIGHFVKNYYDTSMSIVAVLEILLWFRLLGPALLFKKGSWVLLVFYSLFLRSRVTQSIFVQGAIRQLAARGDAVANRQDIPPVARQVWQQFKDVLVKIHDVTDINKYVQGQQPVQAKKTS